MKATSIVRGIIGKGKQEEGGSTKTEAERRKRAEIEEKSKYMGE